jgi:hypothetical protein
LIDEGEDEGEVEVAREEPGEECALEERMKGAITSLGGRPKHGTPLYCGNHNLELMDFIKEMKNCFECKGIEDFRRMTLLYDHNSILNDNYECALNDGIYSFTLWNCCHILIEHLLHNIFSLLCGIF